MALHELTLRFHEEDAVIVLDPIEREALQKIITAAKLGDVFVHPAALASLQLKLDLAIRGASERTTDR